MGPIGDAGSVPPEIEELDDALKKLEAIDAKKAELVTLRFFSRLSMAEDATALGMSVATADRHWAFARAMAVPHDGAGSL